MKDRLRAYRPNLQPGIQAFPGQSTDEKVVFIIRKHWIVDVAILSKTFFEVFWPLIVYIIASFFWKIPETVYIQVGIVVMHIYILFTLFWNYVKWIDHRLDLIIFTDRRMVDINQTRLFDRKISEANLAQIQDVNSEVKGFLPTVLHYGKLNIQTAGPEGNVFEMTYVRWPSLVASTIIELRDSYTKREYVPRNPSPTP